MAQLNLKARVLEVSIGVLGVPSGSAASSLRALEARWRDDRGATSGEIIALRGDAEATFDDLVGFDYVPPSELHFARRADERGELRGCELRIRLRAPTERTEPGAARRVAERSDGVLVLVDPSASPADVERLVAELADGGRDRPVITWSRGDDGEVLDVVEKLVERTLDAREPASDRIAAGPRHPLLESLRAILVEVTEDHLRRIEASLGERLAARMDARLAELGDVVRSEGGKRLADVDRRLARFNAEVTGRASSEAKWRSDESARTAATLERVEAVHHVLAEIDPDVAEMRAGMTELGAALTTIAGTLATLVQAADASAARARRTEEAIEELGRDRPAPDPRTLELVREVTELCEEIKRKKKGWFS